VSITTPKPGDTLTTAQITIAASASDNVGGSGVEKVSFHIDGILRAVDWSAPYEYAWDLTIADNGDHALKSRVYDKAGNEGTPSTVDVAVDIAGVPDGGGDDTWSQSFGGDRADRGQAVAVDSSTGDLVLAGFYYGAVDIGDGQLPCSDSRSHMVVAKYDANGGLLWSKCGDGGTGNIGANAVAIDPTGNILVTGVYSGTVQLGSQTLSSAGGSDAFVAMYSTDGELRWAKRAGYRQNDAGYAVAADGDGNILTTGAMFDEQYASIIYVDKYAPSGVRLWSRHFKGSGNNYGRGIALDAQDNVLVTGHFYGVMELEGTSLSVGDNPILSSPSILLAKFDSSGDPIWAEQIGGDNEGYSRALAVDPLTGASVIAGYFFGTTNFGDGSVSSSSYDSFLAKYDANGKHLWSRTFPNAGTEVGTSVAVEPTTGDIFLAGTFNEDASFGGPLFALKGNTDTFIARYRDTDGAHIWSQAYGGESATTSVQGLAVDETGTGLFATGYFTKTVDFRDGALTGDSAYGDIFLLGLAP
jgi:hypothetical protein